MLKHLHIFIFFLLAFVSCKTSYYDQGYPKSIGRYKMIPDKDGGPEFEVKVGKWKYFACDTTYLSAVEHYDRKGRMHGPMKWHQCDSTIYISGQYKHGYRTGYFEIYDLLEGYLKQEYCYDEMPDSLKGTFAYKGEYGRLSGYVLWFKEYDAEGNIVDEFHR